MSASVVAFSVLATFSPIHGLPPEILSLIFISLCYWHDPGSGSFVHSRYVVSSVCSLWHAVAQSIPDLWRALVVDHLCRDSVLDMLFHRQSALDIMLRVCRGGPLSIAVASSQTSGAGSILRGVARLRSSSHQWQRFTLRCRDALFLRDVLALVAGFPAPSLRYFRVQLDDAMSDPRRDIRLMSWTLPFPTSFLHLETFDITGIPFPEDLPPMPSLRHLLLRGLPTYCWPTASQLLTFFDTSPLITDLSFRGGGVVVPDTALPVIILPCVRYLELSFVRDAYEHTQSLLDFLRSVTFPALEVVDVTFVSRDAVHTFIHGGWILRSPTLRVRGAVHDTWPLLCLYTHMRHVVHLDLRGGTTSMVRALSKTMARARPAYVLPHLRRLSLLDPQWGLVLETLHTRRTLRAPSLALSCYFTSPQGFYEVHPDRTALRPLITSIECSFLPPHPGHFAKFDEPVGYDPRVDTSLYLP
ncbi:hypothetical protein C8R43DRAFT_1120233 [Mycena crocata]|nr:hypothetical protein C8R43DRAFT_1120233 [Mycena crocata]